MATFALFLALAPVASADKGVVGVISENVSTPRGVAVNHTGNGGVPAGTVYVAESANRRIRVFDSHGEFISAWGYDVVPPGGAGNVGTPVNEKQSVTFSFEFFDPVTGGTFTLTFENQPTPDIAFNAPPATVDAALEALPGIGAGNVEVTGSPGGPYNVEFIGALGQVNVPPISGDGSKLTTNFNLGASVSVTTTVPGGHPPSYEICTAASGDVCQAGQAPPSPARIGTFSEPTGISVDQADGSVYVSDRAQLRVMKFSATGERILTFGKNVNSTGGSGFEICTQAENTCQTGSTGTLAGEFQTATTGGLTLSVVPAPAPNAGNIVVTDPGNRRVQEFTSAGAFARTFGWDVITNGQPTNEPQNEVQRVTVTATSGTFTLTFGSQTTAPIAYNALAATVQTALTALSQVGAGNATVTGGPGDATGSAPYEVTFIGARKDQDLAEMTVNGSNLGGAPGKTVSCTGPAADVVTYQWLRNGVPIVGATASTYQLSVADEGAAVQCQTFAKLNANGAGSTQASTPVVNASPPPGTARPVAPSGNLPTPTRTTTGPGQSLDVGADGGIRLNCATGTWTGGAVGQFSYQWYRNGVPLSGNGADTNQYIVQTVDLTSPAYFQCAVTATNAGGSVTKVTALGGSISGPTTTPVPDPSIGLAATTSSLASVATTTQGAKFEVCSVAASCKAASTFILANPFSGEAGRFQGGMPTRIAADSTGAIYTVVSQRVHKFTPQAGPPVLAPSIFGSDGAPNDSAANIGAPQDLTVGLDDRVFVLKEIQAGVTPECLDGEPSSAERRIQELSSDGMTLLDTHLECAELGQTSNSGGIGTNPESGDIYVTSSAGAGSAGHRVVILNETIPPTIDVSSVTPAKTTISLKGKINPNPNPGYVNPPSTAWQAQYKLSTESTWTRFANPKNIGAGSSDVPFKTTIVGLLPNTEYDVRMVATKAFESAQTIGTPETTSTVEAAPAIQTVFSSNVTVSSAQLNARIDPQGSDSSYYFEYGTTPNYGNTTPETDIGDGQNTVAVSNVITDLEDVVYHFRVVAKNNGGTTVGENQTFLFHPPSCPNETVRQQTQANYLPDCRAYELVTPKLAGGAVIVPYRGPPASEATNPSRLAYNAIYGVIPDTGDPPNAGSDIYVSTRTSTGWETKFVGLPANEMYVMGGPPGFNSGEIKAVAPGVVADPTLERILNWAQGHLSPSGIVGRSNAPYLWASNGDLIERWPTNLATVEDGEGFLGESWPSEDLTNFVFSSDIAFTLDGYPGAIYDNDTEAGTIEVVSKTDTGAEFTGSPLKISRDGSHILMNSVVTPPCSEAFQDRCPTPPAAPFYMRVNGTSYSVSKGHDATFAGMTRDGSTVYFTTAEAATADDHDASVDLFMWREETDSLVRVSAGSGDAGDTDDCDALDSWTAKCDAKLISDYAVSCRSGCWEYDTTKPHFFSGYAAIIAGKGGNGLSDSFVASESGDIYFVSPELLDGPGNGVEGGVNLYVYSSGSPQFVTTLSTEPACQSVRDGNGNPKETYCGETSIGRMQVTPDGSHAAFLSQSRLTSYDNAGQTEMYRYQPSTDTLICVSCIPGGEPPTPGVLGPVQGSMNGLFLADDGRTFFSKLDSLTPQDTNNAADVYEYVDGRAQLISQGTGPIPTVVCDNCSGASIRPGLVGVSADGTDVYIATFDVLTPQDQNGGNLKIYDARTNGGFLFSPPPPPCAAADECHGPTSSAPPPIPDGTGSTLGKGGNGTPSKAKRKKAKRQAKSQRKKQRKKIHKKRHSHSKNGRSG